MESGEYVVGLAFALVTFGSILAASSHLQGAFGDQEPGVARTLALGVWSTVLLFLVHLVPGVIGILSGASVAVLSLGVFLAAIVVRRERPRAAPAEFAVPALRLPRGFDEWAACLAVGAVAAYLLALVIANGRTPPVNVDATGFHLPGVGQWIQDGSIVEITQFFPGVPTGQYPQSGDILLLSVILPWENAAFVRLPNPVYLVMAALAVFGLGRELGARWPAALSFAALLLAVPATHEPATDILMTDAPLYATFAAGLYFLARHARTKSVSDLVLAGLSLGFAFGAKWYGVSSVIVVLAVWTAASMTGERRARFGEIGRLFGLVAATGGFWLIRNWVETGNPISPVKVALGELTIFDAPTLPVLDQTFHSIFDYVTDAGVWSDFLVPAFDETLALPAALLLGAALAAVFVGRREPQRRLLGLGAITIVGLLLAYALTPSSAFGLEGEPILAAANTRYAVPALIVAAPLGAWLATRLGRWAPALYLALLVAIGHGLWQGYDDGFDGPIGFAHVVAAMIALGFALVVLRSVPSMATRLQGSRPLVWATLVAGLAAVGVAGYVWQDRFNRDGYLGEDATFDPVLALSDPVSVGLAGVADTTGVYPAWPYFGSEIQNEVTYIGEEEGEVVFNWTDRSGFIAELDRQAPDYLSIGLGVPPQPSVEPEAWARDAGYEEVARSDRVVLFARE